MKFIEIIPGLLKGKKFYHRNWEHDDSYIYAYVYGDGGYGVYHQHGINAGHMKIGSWLTSNDDVWEEYKERKNYPKNLSFMEACRLAEGNGAIISTDDHVKYDWRDGLLREYDSGELFKPNAFIFHKWNVVGYKGEEI